VIPISNLSEKERYILNILEENPFISQQEIADRIAISRSAAANLLSGLQEKGYILGKPYLLNKSRYVTCIGGANLDHKFVADADIIPGTSNPVRSKASFGGVIRNVAENLGRLDLNVSLMSIVGMDPAGDQILQDCKKSMNVFATERLYGENTGSYYAIIGRDGNMLVGYADMAICDHMDRQWILDHKGHLRLGSWLIADCNIRKDAMEELIAMSRAEERSLAVIGVSAPKMENVPADIDGVAVVICNRDESQAYFRTGETDAAKLCALWLKAGVRKAVVTAGKEGFAYGQRMRADSMSEGETPVIRTHRVQPVLPEEIVDVTGAGDSFSAGVLFGLISGETLDSSVGYGAVNSAMTIKSPNSVRPDLTKAKLIEEVKNYENI